ncbi:UNVERIFIED_CONTAM: hypothetical protein GTU68_033805, partial [Idotea baltica]|nr:hypothetical protein [Idotea baltica]
MEAAKHFGTEIISADSRQVYRELNIGVAKPSYDELTQTKHHFINHTSIAESYSVGQYEREAILRIDHYFKTHNTLICSGGTGLYLNALRYGIDKFPETSPDIKASYERMYEQEGIQMLQQLLQEKDPIYYADVDIYNQARLIRALTVCDSSNQPYSSFLLSQNIERPFHVIPILLTRDRAELYDRINRRVDLMIQSG